MQDSLNAVLSVCNSSSVSNTCVLHAHKSLLACDESLAVYCKSCTHRELRQGCPVDFTDVTHTVVFNGSESLLSCWSSPIEQFKIKNNLYRSKLI